MQSNARTTTEAGDALWYKDAILYQLHVKAFADSNNDGIGDFAGLTDRLDYVQELGVTTLWLQPFYPSPGRDEDRKSTRLNSSHGYISYAVFCLKKKNRRVPVGADPGEDVLERL